MKITFNLQIITAALISLLGFIMSQFLGNGLYYNLAWVISGLIFLINPLYPEGLISLEGKKAEKSIRIAAVLIIFAGLTGAF